jgi:hypothetical protein
MLEEFESQILKDISENIKKLIELNEKIIILLEEE